MSSPSKSKQSKTNSQRKVAAPMSGSDSVVEFPIDRPGIVEVVTNPEHSSLWEVLRHLGSAVSPAELAKVTGRTLPAVVKSIDVLNAAGLLRRVAATRTSPGVRYSVMSQKITLRWDPTNPRHAAIHGQIGRSFEARSTAHVNSIYEQSAPKAVTPYRDRRLHWEHYTPEDLKELKAIFSILDTLAERVNRRRSLEIPGEGRSARITLPCNYHIAWAIVPVEDGFPALAQVHAECIKNDSFADRSPGAVAAARLTNRESQVLEGLMKGQSLAAIGTSLKVSRATVATLASHCYKKFGVSGRQQLAAVVMGGQSSQ
jgi:DNA-binding CsgD family transcriptional regulator/predicted transcriptional regulator